MAAQPTQASLASLTPAQLRKLIPGLGSARITVRDAWRAGLRRDPPIKPSEWAEKYRVVGEGTSPHSGKWRNGRTPYLTEIIDCLAASHPARRVTFMKSAQIGGSEVITNALFWIADAAPGPVLVVHPTIEAGRDWTNEKLDPSIEATSRVRRRIAAQVIRGRDGSTMKRKRFPGGSIVVTGANSAAGLRQKSIKYLFCDDLDEFPLAVAGQGDPLRMARARQISFQKIGADKEFDVSTPTLKSVSRIARQWEQGTQGWRYLPCPHCGAFQTLKWGGPHEKFGIKFDPTPPHRAHYVCEAEGCIIENWQLAAMDARGEWRHARPEPGREPSYRINALYSPVTTWDKAVQEFLDAKDDPEKLKTFVNLWLGEPWDETGDRPKAAALMERRETWALGTVPPGVLMISLGCDVGADGIWYQAIGWGRDRQSWSLEHGFLDGDTGTASGEAWRSLDALRRKTWRDGNGVDRPIEAVAVDANYQTEVVTEWCKTRLGCHAVRGEDGWKVPAWLGRTSLREFTERGRGRRRGTKTYPVGTWSLKARFYGELAVKKAPEDIGFPPGYCHFSQDWTEDDFEQLLSEVFVRQRDRKTGRERQGWHVIGKANHLLDTRIYAEAMAEKLGLSTKSPAEWEWLERKWQRLVAEQRSLFDAPQLPDAPPLAAATPPANQHAARPATHVFDLVGTPWPRNSS